MMLDMEACPKVSAVVRDRLLLPAWTAVRANEARKAEWKAEWKAKWKAERSRFGLEDGVWTIPAPHEEAPGALRPLPRQRLAMPRKRKEACDADIGGAATRLQSPCSGLEGAWQGPEP